MAELMLVNPKKRTKRGKKKMAARKKRRTPAQKRATAKLVAYNKRRRTPARRKRRTLAATATPAPARRRRALSTMRAARRRTPTRSRAVTRRVYRRNPSRKTMMQNIVSKQIQPAAIQASGAIGLDVVYGYFGQFIPAQLNSGMIRHVTKGVVALGLGFVASNFIKNTTAEEMAKGALTVTMHGAFKEALQQFMPAIPLGYCDSDMGYYNPSPVYEPQSQNMNMGYFEANSGAGYSPHANGLGYFSSDTGAGYASMRSASENDLFDTADI
jgi:hypothetical protein